MNWQTAKNIEENKYDLPGEWLRIEYFEVLNILFRVENALRAFVYITLKNEFQDKWKDLSITSDDEENSTISAIAKRRIAQDKNYAYLGYSISTPLVHLTSGELIRIITSEKYWKLFKSCFPGSKEIIKNKLDEIGNVRNSVAHFRPIKKGDVELIKQNSVHTLSDLEKKLVDFISCSDRVPTNTEDLWYKEMMTLQSEYCSLSFYQGKKEEWIQVTLRFKSPFTIGSRISSFVKFNTYNLKTYGILNGYPELLKYIITVTENNPSPFTENIDEVKIIKTIAFTLSNSTIAKNYKIIKEEFEKIILQINTELNLIQQDNLARGKLIEIISVYLEKPQNSEYFRIDGNNPFRSVLDEDTPPEFWGELSHASENFITNTNKFPWMPDEISDDVSLPF